MAAKLFVTLAFLGVTGAAMLFLAEADRDLLAIAVGASAAAMVLVGLAIRKRKGTQVTSASPAQPTRASGEPVPDEI